MVPLFFFFFFFFFFNDTATTEIYTLSLHDALPILPQPQPGGQMGRDRGRNDSPLDRVRERRVGGGAIAVQAALPQLPEDTGEAAVVVLRLELTRVGLLLELLQLLDETLQCDRCHWTLSPWLRRKYHHCRSFREPHVGSKQLQLIRHQTP